MMRYSVQPRDWIFVKGFRFLSLAKNIAKNISKNLSHKYSPGMLAMCQKLLDHTKQSAKDIFKTASKRSIQKTAKITGDLIGITIAHKIIVMHMYLLKGLYQSQHKHETTQIMLIKK